MECELGGVESDGDFLDGGPEPGPEREELTGRGDRGTWPDRGYFPAKELKQHSGETSILNLKPERGVLEVKPVDYDIGALAQTEQVRN
jgi:hypothetical protein